MVEKKTIKIGVAFLAGIALVIGLSVGLTQNNKNATNPMSASNAEAVTYNFETDCPPVLASSGSKSSKGGSGSKSSKSGCCLGNFGRGKSCFCLDSVKDLSLSSQRTVSNLNSSTTQRIKRSAKWQVW
jgi:hypothetical protein